MTSKLLEVNLTKVTELVLRARSPSTPVRPWITHLFAVKQRMNRLPSLNASSVMFGLVWFGLIWSGLVWSGLVWFGLVWFSLVWLGLVWLGLVWSDLVYFGLFWSGLVWSGLVWFGLACHGLVWFGLIWFSVRARDRTWGLVGASIRQAFCH